jgi:hypothetical protein
MVNTKHCFGELRMQDVADKKPSSDMAEDRRQFWLAAFRGVICATEGNCARFEAYFDMAGWWTFDVFIVAVDIGIVVPDWNLTTGAFHFCFLMKQHQKDTCKTLLRLEEQERKMTRHAYNGRHCWY